MAAFARHESCCVLISGKNIAVFELGSDKKETYTCERKEELKAQDNSEGDGVCSGRVLASAFSRSGKYFAACDDWKQLTLWETSPSWTLKSVRGLVRRAMTLTFTRSEDKVIVGDKSGDVYSYATSNPEEPGLLLMGHLSMLLDLRLADNDKYVVTCDRDEKIRVSRFPNAYNIHTFCLGHEEFVSRLVYFEETDIIVSGSGDGTIRTWDYQKGKELHVTDCYPLLKVERTESEASDQNETRVDVRCLACHQKNRILAASFDGKTDVCIFKLQEDSSLELVQQLSCGQCEVWHLTVDDQGLLWVLTADTEHLHVYSCNSHTGKYEKITEENHAFEWALLNRVNSDPEFFKESENIESSLKLLHKPKTVDHVEEYKQKKQARLAGQKRKANPASENGKKSKEPESQQEAAA